MDGIDLIIDGHAHQVMLGEGSAGNNAQMVNGTKIVSAGSSLAYLGRVDMNVGTNSGEPLSMTASRFSAAAQAASSPLYYALAA